MANDISQYFKRPIDIDKRPATIVTHKMTAPIFENFLSAIKAREISITQLGIYNFTDRGNDTPLYARDIPPKGYINLLRNHMQRLSGGMQMYLRMCMCYKTDVILSIEIDLYRRTYIEASARASRLCDQPLILVRSAQCIVMPGANIEQFMRSL